MRCSNFVSCHCNVDYLQQAFLALAGLDKPTRIQSIARHFDIDVENGLRYGEAEFAKINKIIEADCVVAHKYLKSAIEL